MVARRPGGHEKGSINEDRYPPGLRRHRSDVFLRKHVHHPQHGQVRSPCHAEVCSACHPFYTGKQKIMDVGGRVDRFEKRYAQARPQQQLLAFCQRPQPDHVVWLRALTSCCDSLGRKETGHDRSGRPDGILATRR